MPIRTAVIGFGVAGRVFHTPFLAADDRYRLDVVVTGDPERAAQVRAAHPSAEVLATAEEVWERADHLDLVVVATPPVTHVGLATAALEHGLHVVVDKPFAPSADEARRIVAAGERTGRLVTVFQNRRWDGDFLTLRRLVEEGELGTVETFESRFEWWKPEGAGRWKATTSVADGGGILLDLGSHLIDQAVQLFGDVTSVAGEAIRRTSAEGSDADDDTYVVLTHASGTRSRLVMSSRSAIGGPRFHVLGSRGAHVKWGLDPQEAALAAGAHPHDPDFGVEPPEHRSVVGVGDDVRTPTQLRGDYGAFYRLLADAVEHDGPVPVDPADAVHVLELIERIPHHP